MPNAHGNLPRVVVPRRIRGTPNGTHVVMYGVCEYYKSREYEMSSQRHWYGPQRGFEGQNRPKSLKIDFSRIRFK